MKTCTLLLVASVVVCSVTSAAMAQKSICPWRTVTHVDDPSIEFLGRWAVEQQHSVLRFNKVDSATAQAVGDCENNINRIYNLMIDASNAGSGNGKYNAVVSVINRTEPQKVLSFKAVASR